MGTVNIGGTHEVGGDDITYMKKISKKNALVQQ